MGVRCECSLRVLAVGVHCWCLAVVVRFFTVGPRCGCISRCVLSGCSLWVLSVCVCVCSLGVGDFLFFFAVGFRLWVLAVAVSVRCRCSLWIFDVGVRCFSSLRVLAVFFSLLDFRCSCL